MRLKFDPARSTGRGPIYAVISEMPPAPTTTRVIACTGGGAVKLELHPRPVPGHEVVGTVTEVGEDVSDFRIGDRVVVPHHVPCGSCPLCRRGSETLCETFRENLLSPGGFSEHTPRPARDALGDAGPDHRLGDGELGESVAILAP